MIRTESNDAIMSARERIAWAVQEVARGLKEGTWSIREGCKKMKIHPQTYYKHRKRQASALEGSGDGPIAAAGAPLHTSPVEKASQAQDSTNESAARNIQTPQR